MSEGENGPKSTADKIEGALDFYGNPSNYQHPPGDPAASSPASSPAEVDGGQRAREVLKEWTGRSAGDSA